MATQFTSNLRLALPDFDQTPWDDDVNGDMIILDAVVARFFGVANMMGVWKNTTAYTSGQSVVDAVDSSMWTCLSSHTSSNAPTLFSEERSNRPGLWTIIVSTAKDYATAAQASANAANTSAQNAAASATSAQNSASVVAGAVPLSGGTMTGLLVLSGDPTNVRGAATKQYVDARVGGVGFLPTTGGTMTGPIVLSGAPTLATQAANKGYVDTFLPIIGGTMTGNLTLFGAPTTANMAATKAYVDGFLPLAGGTLAGNLTVGGNTFTTALYINPANNWEWYFAIDGSGNHYQTHRATGWYDQWISSNGTRVWVGNSVQLMTLDGSGNLTLGGNASIPGGLGITYNGGHAVRFSWDGTFPHAIVDNSADIQLASTSWVNGNFITSATAAATYAAAPSTTQFSYNANGNMYFNNFRGGFSVQVGVATDHSDIRLKSNVGDPGDGLALINQLSVHSFDYTPPGSDAAHMQHWQCGVIAQEVADVIPEAFIPAISDQCYASVSTLSLIGTLIRAVQQLCARVIELEETAYV
jgi:hypothetical protein